MFLRTPRLASALFLGGAAIAPAAHAHAIAGDRIFPATIATDDPSVASEISLPTANWFPAPVDSNGNVPQVKSIGGELDILLLPNFALGISDGWSAQTARGEQGAYGFGSIQLSAKYKFFEDDDREMLMSVGLKTSVGGTGAMNAGDNGFSTFTPTFYFGKGMGDLPDSMALLKPFAITGTVGLLLPQSGQDSYQFQPGITIEYSMLYLKTAVKDYDLPEFLNRLVPLVEVPLSLGLNRDSSTWGGTVNPGVIYLANKWQLAIEANLPVTANDQHGVGIAVQFHVFLDDWLPEFRQPLLGGTL
ncbi:MAG TPA: hypothetical protein VNW15_02250 [Rhizomicrobium sp.]|nr:hypothetical protein [Rhizomicrobium sp.]